MAEQGSSAQDPEPGDTISLEALSEEDLSHIANNPHYSMLQDLLAPYIAGTSADSHPVVAQDCGHGSDPTTRNLEAAETGPDKHLSDIHKRVNTTALGTLQHSPSAEVTPPAAKRQWLMDSDSDTVSETSLPGITHFDPSSNS